jgi:hypothetical protein
MFIYIKARTPVTGTMTGEKALGRKHTAPETNTKAAGKIINLKGVVPTGSG